MSMELNDNLLSFRDLTASQGILLDGVARDSEEATSSSLKTRPAASAWSRADIQSNADILDPVRPVLPPLD